MGPGGYFLPFTPNGKAIELVAIEMKKRLGLDAEASVDPYDVLDRVPARLVDVEELRIAAPAVAAQLFGSGRDEWSAVCFGAAPKTGVFDILVNPTHHVHRRRASLMEEIVHVLRKHPMTVLSLNGATTGVSVRSYNPAIEDEAYCVGAACIIPYPHLFHAVHDNGANIAEIAAVTQVSVDYVAYRIKRAGLSRVYAKQHPIGVTHRSGFRIQ